MKIGFIGLGQMGSCMAANLIKGGHQVMVYNRTPEKMQVLVSDGAYMAKRLEDACRNDVVITMLSDDKAVERIAFGNMGVIDSMDHKAIHISMSTISVKLSDRLYSEHTRAGQEFISAPVFGKPDSAAAAKLFIIAAGKHKVVESIRPLFDLMGQKTFYIGKKPSDANLFKLSGNFLIASVIESLGEAMALVGKAGIDRNKFLEILTSTLFPAPVYKNYGKLIIDGKYRPAGFSAYLGKKDIGLILNAAEDLKVPMPLVNLLQYRFSALLAGDGEDLDWSALAQLSERESGLSDMAGEVVDTVSRARSR